MPLVKALKTFRGKYGLIRTGTTFNSDPRYADQLKKKGWLEVVGEGEQPAEKPEDPKPSKNRNIPKAPARGGKDSAAGKGASLPPAAPLSSKAVLDTRRGSGRPPAAGKGSTSSSLRADLPPPAKTAKPSESGGQDPALTDEGSKSSQDSQAGE